MSGLRDLEDLSNALEAATQAYAAACNETAKAENDYLRKFHLAWATSTDQKIPASIRAKHTDNQPDVVEARCVLNSNEAVERSARAKVSELDKRLMAAMSYTKYLGANG